MYNPSLLFDNRSCLAEWKKNLGLLKKDKKSSPFLSSLPGCCWSVSHEIEVSIFSKREGREGGLFVVTNPSSYQSPICRRNLEDMKIFAPETFLQKSKSTLNIPYLICRSSVKKVPAKLRDFLSIFAERTWLALHWQAAADEQPKRKNSNRQEYFFLRHINATWPPLPMSRWLF